MAISPDSDEHGDQPPGASDDDLNEPVPEWAPLEPLPSSEMFLATFAGFTPVAAPDILEPAEDLVECQRQYRQAFAVLSHPNASAEQLKAAAAALISAHADLEMLIMVIDDAVADRLLQRRNGRQYDQRSASPVDGAADVAVHTESVGEIAARMAELWEQLVERASDLDELPEAYQLCELSAAYDHLAAEIESGRRIPPGL